MIGSKYGSKNNIKLALGRVKINEAPPRSQKSPIVDTSISMRYLVQITLEKRSLLKALSYKNRPFLAIP